SARFDYSTWRKARTMRYLEDISYYENLPNFPKSPEKREAFYRGYERAKKAQETILEDSYLPPIEEYERRSDFPTDPEKQKQFINGYFEIMRRRVKNSEGAVNYYDTQRDYILNKIK